MIVATLCYLKYNGRTLMLHRIKKEQDMHEGKWNGLGGKCEPGETPEECVVREVHEESGLAIRDPKLAGVLTFPNFHKGQDWLVFVYTADSFSGDLIDSPEGNLEWVDDDKVTDLNLWAGDRIFMGWIAENRLFSGKFLYEDGELKKHDVTFH